MLGTLGESGSFLSNIYLNASMRHIFGLDILLRFVSKFTHNFAHNSSSSKSSDCRRHRRHRRRIYGNDSGNHINYFSVWFDFHFLACEWNVYRVSARAPNSYKKEENLCVAVVFVFFFIRFVSTWIVVSFASLSYKTRKIMIMVNVWREEKAKFNYSFGRLSLSHRLDIFWNQQNWWSFIYLNNSFAVDQFRLCKLIVINSMKTGMKRAWIWRVWREK